MKARLLAVAETILIVVMILPGCRPYEQTTMPQDPDEIILEESMIFAPYIAIGDFNADDALSANLRYVTLAFVADSGLCKPIWTGAKSVDENTLQEIAKFRNAGGDVIVSFGGGATNPKELAYYCKDQSELERQYQAIIDQFGATRIDFDIEAGLEKDDASISRRNVAIKNLQKRAREEGRQLLVSYTLGVDPNVGLPAGQLAIIKNAHKNGAVISVVNIMAMDYGSPNNQMGKSAIDAANALFRQLKRIYTQRTDDELWRMVGITPMIGLNDSAGEIFTIENAKEVASFANSKRIGRLSMWALSRDKQCEAGEQKVDLYCSGIQQEPWDFTCIFTSCKTNTPIKKARYS